MRSRSIAVMVLIVVLSSAITFKHMYFPVLRGQAKYYFLSLVWLCGILIVFMTASLILSSLRVRKKMESDGIHVDWANRRNTFRIIYPAPQRPILVIDIIDHNPARLLEFSIIDLSQGGCCFLDDGSLGVMQSFSGYIRFADGDRIKVAGRSIRKTGNQISIEFQDAIDWSALINEQRRILAIMKSTQQARIND